MIGALMLAYIASYAFVSAIPDTNRDMFLAQGIVSGRHYPLEGPILGGAIHLGPFWYYLMAIPIAITSSWLGATLFIGFLASLKFPLAYLCGKSLIDARFGLLWALLLALPGWHDYERLTIFNPNPAAAAALALTYVALRFKASAPSYRALLGCGVLLGVAIHIHPTVAIVGILPIAATLAHRGHSRVALARLAQLSTYAFGALLPLLPYVLNQIALGYPDAAAANTYVSQSVAGSGLLKLPLLLWSMFAVGPYVALNHIAKFSGVTLVLVGLLVVGLYLAACAGLVRLAASGRRGCTLLAITLAGAAIAFAWVLMLRVNTPVYFTYWLTPICSGIVAFGLAQWPLFKRAGLIIFLLVLSLSIRSAWMIAATMNTGVGSLPGSQEIKQLRPSEPYVDIWLPAYAHGALGDFMCSLPIGASLHGPLAHAADWNVNTDALLACKRATRATLGGSTSPQVLGMPRQFWDRIEATPDCTIGPIGIARQTRVLVSAAGEIADGARYLPREFFRAETHTEKFHFDLATDEALLITNYLFPYSLALVVGVTVDGAPVAPVATTEMARIYASPLKPTNAIGADSRVWEVAISFSNPEGLDIVAVAKKNAQSGAHLSACRP